MTQEKKIISRDENGNTWGIELEKVGTKYFSSFILNGKKFEHRAHSSQKDANTFWMLIEEIIKKNQGDYEQNSNYN